MLQSEIALYIHEMLHVHCLLRSLLLLFYNYFTDQEVAAEVDNEVKKEDVIQVVGEPEKSKNTEEEIEPATPEEKSDKKEDEIEELKPTEDSNAEVMVPRKARIPPPMLGKVSCMFL